MTQNRDFREDFISKILINEDIMKIINKNNTIGTPIVSDKINIFNRNLDIKTFKIKFNNMLLGLGSIGTNDDNRYTMYDLLKFYATGSSLPDGETYGYGSDSDITSTNWSTPEYLSSTWLDKKIEIPQLTYKDAHRNILSNFIMDIIVEAIDSRFSSNSDYSIGNSPQYSASNYFRGQDNNYNPYASSSKNFIKAFKDHIGGSNGPHRGLNISDIIDNFNDPSDGEYVNILNYLNNELNIFELYDYIIILENTIDYSYIELEKTYSKILYFIQNYLVMYILKYFLLTELLLKTLLDTRENQGNTTNDTTNLNYLNSSDLNRLSNEQGYYKGTNVINDNYDYENTNSIFNNNDVGMKLTQEQIVSGADSATKIKDTLSVYVYKIIKDMWLINYSMEKNITFLSSENIEYINTQHRGSGFQSEAVVQKLNTKVDIINNNITELNLKNLNLQKKYEKNKNMYYIVISLIVIFIFLNLYVIKNNKLESLLTINGVIVIVILLTKFFSLIKKSYQTLVKDLNN